MLVKISKQRRLRQVSGYSGGYLRWLSGALLLALVICLVYAGLEVMLSPQYFPLTKIKISGEFSHIKPAAIQHRVAPYLQRGFWGVSTSALQEELQQLPWVDKVSVSRRWPRALTVTLTEHQPLAHWNGNALVNQRGQVFTPPDVNSQHGLPFFIGPLGQQMLMLATYQDLTKLLQPIGLSINQLYLTDRHAWQLQLSNGLIINLGNQNIIDRMRQFTIVYEQLFAMQAQAIAYVDMRYNNGIAVKWKA